jgi:nicotinamidase-related amidase
MAGGTGPLRVWNAFLTERDRAYLETLEVPTPAPIGARPVLLMIDLYRWAYGDRPVPLPDSAATWPGSCGLTAWEAIPPTVALLEAGRRAGIPVVHTTVLPGAVPRPHRRLKRHARTGFSRPEEWADPFAFKEEFAPLEGEIVLEKIAASAFFGTPLAAILTLLECDSLILAGETTSGCVRASAVDGWASGHRVTVVEDCVFDRTDASHAMSLFDIDQKYGSVRALDDVAGELDRLRVHPTASPAREPTGAGRAG